MWFHSSPHLIRDGEAVLSAADQGIDPTSFGIQLEEAVAVGVALPDRVFVYQHHSDDPRQHFGLGPWVSKDSYVYEVEPIGTLEDDPGLGADPDNFKCCLKATVRRCIHLPESAL